MMTKSITLSVVIDSSIITKIRKKWILQILTTNTLALALSLSQSHSQ